MPTWTYVLERFKEKSTWVAIGSVLTSLGITVSPERWQVVMAIGMGVPSLVAIFLPARVTENNVKPDPNK